MQTCKWPIEIVDLLSYKIVIFHSYVTVFTRGYFFGCLDTNGITQEVSYQIDLFGDTIRDDLLVNSSLLVISWKLQFHLL